MDSKMLEAEIKDALERIKSAIENKFYFSAIKMCDEAVKVIENEKSMIEINSAESAEYDGIF